MYVVYADELFLENLMIDYILLILTARLVGTDVRRLRVLAAAALGGAYSAMAAVIGMSFLGSAVYKIAMGIIMVLLVFWESRRIVRICLIFFALSAAFAGALMAVLTVSGGGLGDVTFGHVTFGVLALSFGVLYFVFSMVFRRITGHNVRGEMVDMEIGLGGRRVKVRALMDTGNSLREPVSGAPVTVCALEAILPLFDRVTARLLENVRDPANALGELAGSGHGPPGFCLVPYNSLGRQHGMLLGFRPDVMLRDGVEIRGGMVAIAPEGLISGNGYLALTNTYGGEENVKKADT